MKLLRSGEDVTLKMINEDLMERVIEELELGWNVLTEPLRKLQQRKEAAMFPEEVPCEICGDCDTSNCNVIVLCDDCDLAVHQECYGVSHIPEGPWLCRPCTERRRSNSSLRAKCLLCPWPGGALRKTTDHRWVHSLCAYMVPETAMSFVPSDPYDLVDVCTLHADRAKLKCVLCRGDCQLEISGNGYPIQCASKLCHVAFHPMCARAAGWYLQYSSQKAYCSKHSPENVNIMDCTPTEGNEVDVHSSSSGIKLRLNLSGSNSSVSAAPLSPTKNKFPSVLIGENCPLHVTRSGEKLRIPTYAPKVLIEHICKDERVFKNCEIPFTLRFHVIKKISKYWALKREHRRGTTLLKSLQLEPSWSQSDAISEEAFSREYSEKVALLNKLRKLGDKLKLVKDREIAKLVSFESSMKIFEILSSPFSLILENFILKLQREVDQPGYFAHPVPCDLLPDYPLIIQYPMDFSTILNNLKSDLTGNHNHELFYPTLHHFFADLKLIWENSRMYNTKTSVFYLAADRLEFVACALIDEIWKYFSLYKISGPFDVFSIDNVSSEDPCDFYSIELPEPTPARFPKAENPQIISVDRRAIPVKKFSDGPRTGVKRRGRPPKIKDMSSSSAGSSFDSIVSNESLKSQNNSNYKKRGRPFKNIENDSELIENVAYDKAEEEEEIKNLFWVKLKSGNWCAGELFVDPAARSSRRNGKSVKLFDAFKTVVTSVDESCLLPLTFDFETDFESLQVEGGVSSRKLLFNSHRQALSSLKSKFE